MVSIGNVLRALGAGGVGGVANVVFLSIVWTATSAPAPAFEPAFFYKQIAWGGIWGLMFLIPFLQNNWWLRGIVWGVAATIVFIVFFAPSGGGFDPMRLVVGLLANAGAWGLTASWLYSKG